MNCVIWIIILRNHWTRRKLKTVSCTTISKNKDKPFLYLKISSPVHISHSTVVIPFTTDTSYVRYNRCWNKYTAKTNITWTQSHLSYVYLQTSNWNLLTKKLNLPFLCFYSWQQFLCTTLSTLRCCRWLKNKFWSNCTKFIPYLLGLDDYWHPQLFPDY